MQAERLAICCKNEKNIIFSPADILQVEEWDKGYHKIDISVKCNSGKRPKCRKKCVSGTHN